MNDRYRIHQAPEADLEAVLPTCGVELFHKE